MIESVAAESAAGDRGGVAFHGDPGKAMDQVLPDSCYASFTYVI